MAGSKKLIKKLQDAGAVVESVTVTGGGLVTDIKFRVYCGEAGGFVRFTAESAVLDMPMGKMLAAGIRAMREVTQEANNEASDDA